LEVAVIRLMVCVCFALVLGAALPRAARAEVKHKRVHYKIKSTTMTGLLAWDDSFSGPRPGVFVLHDSYGLSVAPLEYADTRERMCMEERRCLDLAALGYIAFAADLYADRRPKNEMEEQRHYASLMAADPYQLERSFAMSRARAGMEKFCAQPALDASRIACLGWGHGGLVAFQVAARDPRIRAVCVCYPYVRKLTPETTLGVKCPVLVLIGREDERVFADNYRMWERGAREGGMRVETIYYRDAHHGFADPHWMMRPKSQKEMEPEREAHAQAWKDTLDFLLRQLGAP
jgi:dienelactone hydrolase